MIALEIIEHMAIRVLCLAGSLTLIALLGALLRLMVHFKVYPFNNKSNILIVLYKDMGNKFLKGKKNKIGKAIGLLNCLIATFGITAMFTGVTIIYTIFRLVNICVKHLYKKLLKLYKLRVNS